MTFLVAMNLLRNPATWAAGALVAIVVAFGAGHFRGVSIGAAKALIKADNATKEAANDLSNAAEGARLRLDICNSTGGVFNFANGKCER